MRASFLLRGLLAACALHASAQVQAAESYGLKRTTVLPTPPAWMLGSSTVQPSFAASQVGDVTGDGRDDVVAVVTDMPGPQFTRVRVYAQQADGSLGTTPMEYPLSVNTAGVLGISLADLNRDGALDVVATRMTAIDILLSDAAGGLSLYTYAAGPLVHDTPIAVADMDRDGVLDLIGHRSKAYGQNAEAAPSRLVVYHGDGQGRIARETSIVTGAPAAYDASVAVALVTGDFATDGRSDVVLRTRDFVYAEQAWSYHLRVFRNDAAGGFRPAYELPTTFDEAEVLHAADVDHDGRDDLVSTERSVFQAQNNVRVHLQRNGRLSETPDVYALPGSAVSLASADLDNDGDQDLLALATSGGFGWFLQSGGTLRPISSILGGVDVSSIRPSTFGAGDLNGDGCADAAVAGTYTGLVIMVGSGCQPRTGRGRGDVDVDGHADLVWRDDSRRNLAIWLMDGAERADGIGYSVSPEWRIIATGDFNGDGALDMLWTNDAQMQIWEGDSYGSFRGLPMPAYPAGWRVVATGDFNGDGTTDLLWRDASNTAANLWAMQGSSIVDSMAYSTAPSEWVAGTGDFDADGRDDVLWTNGASMTLWRSLSALYFVIQPMPTYPAGWDLAGVGDVTGDGKADLMWQHPGQGAFAVWAMSGNQRTRGLGYLPGTAWRIAQTGDFTGDGLTDVVWTNGAVMQLWQSTGRGFTGVEMPNYPVGWSVVRR